MPALGRAHYAEPGPNEDKDTESDSAPRQDEAAVPGQVFEEVPTRVWCKFPGCHKSYASNDGVRKHAKRYHMQWLTMMDSQKLPVSDTVPPEGAPLDEEDKQRAKRARAGNAPASAGDGNWDKGGGAGAGVVTAGEAASAPVPVAPGPALGRARAPPTDPNPANPRNPVVPSGPDTEGADSVDADGSASGAGHSLSFWNNQMPPIKRGPSLLNQIESEFDQRVADAAGGVGAGGSAGEGSGERKPPPRAVPDGAPNSTGPPPPVPSLQLNPSEANLFLNVLDQAEPSAATPPVAGRRDSDVAVQRTATLGRLPSLSNIEEDMVASFLDNRAGVPSGTPGAPTPRPVAQGVGARPPVKPGSTKEVA